MAAAAITVLKQNAPWGPFTREQIEEGIARGDFTLKFLAHTPGLTEWLPLGEVLDYVERHAADRMPTLPPVPGPRELPPIPEKEKPAPPVSMSRPPILPATLPKSVPVPPPPVLPVEKAELESKPKVELVPAPFFRRSIAFLIDFSILFVPVLILFALGALCIEIPAWWRPISHQSRMEEWGILELNLRRLAWLVAIGFGWIYGAGLESSKSQATVGKRWMGLKVVTNDGERIGILQATGRYAAKYLSALPCFLGFFLALIGSRHLALHDRVSDTRVVRA